MQKKLIALALASLAGSAFAQSNVTIYGVADATYDFVGARQSTAATKIANDGRVSANSSYLGFKGAEDLGNGLKAVFQFETGITNDASNSAAYQGGVNASPSNTMFGGIRDTYVGVGGGFGTVVAGNLTAAARALGAKVDVNSGATGVGYQGALYGRLGGARTGVDDRTGNAIAYVSPNFAGFSGMVAWGAGSEQRDTVARTDNVYSLGLNYENGPAYVGYAYTQVAGKALGGADTKAVSNRVGGYFKFGTAQVGALYDRTDADTNTSNNRRNVWLLNGKVGVGAGNVIAGYGKAGKVDGLGNTAAKHYFVGYEHSLSKRTILKAVYAEVKNDSAATYNFYNAATGEVQNLVAGQDPRSISLGIRHSF
ncbi:MAG TPA: porin [Rhodocyclaceae bacterium]|nr:porin [Rhodocyclaceae bacterium]